MEWIKHLSCLGAWCTLRVQILITQLLTGCWTARVNCGSDAFHSSPPIRTFIWGPNAIERGFYPFCLRTSPLDKATRLSHNLSIQFIIQIWLGETKISKLCNRRKMVTQVNKLVCKCQRGWHSVNRESLQIVETQTPIITEYPVHYTNQRIGLLSLITQLYYLNLKSN